MITKKIKVRVSQKIGAIYQEGQKFLPGEIIEIPGESFRPDHYEKIEAPAPKPAPKEPEPPKEEETVELTETTEEPETTEDMQEKMAELPATSEEFLGDVVIDDELVPAEETLDTMASPEEPKKERKRENKKRGNK